MPTDGKCISASAKSCAMIKAGNISGKCASPDAVKFFTASPLTFSHAQGLFT